MRRVVRVSCRQVRGSRDQQCFRGKSNNHRVFQSSNKRKFNTSARRKAEADFGAIRNEPGTEVVYSGFLENTTAFALWTPIVLTGPLLYAYYDADFRNYFKTNFQKLFKHIPIRGSSELRTAKDTLQEQTVSVLDRAASGGRRVGSAIIDLVLCYATSGFISTFFLRRSRMNRGTFWLDFGLLLFCFRDFALGKLNLQSPGRYVTGTQVVSTDAVTQSDYDYEVLLSNALPLALYWWAALPYAMFRTMVRPAGGLAKSVVKGTSEYNVLKLTDTLRGTVALSWVYGIVETLFRVDNSNWVDRLSNTRVLLTSDAERVEIVKS
eukprot:TRINITY_DN428_c0_g1_i1.p1 TRINITY_DN428_c0_g1~~TRINITY_DN428_c0_g1_i1.p1  ORF type:complete len:338 (-),score=66.82 TRINITY_DN428_c0_g1_i1:28-993(-)